MAISNTSAIPQDSRVLVTGVNSYIGSKIAEQFLSNGYKVRGTVRSLTRAAWVQKFFDETYGVGNFELVQIDMTAEGAYDEVAKGVSAIVHVASEVSFSSDPNEVIPASIKGAVNALRAAYAEPSVKRFVLTSSSAAAVAIPNGSETGPEIVTEETWNEDAVKAAWAQPPYGPERSIDVYQASKMQAEQEVWKFHKDNQEKRPDLTVNTVLPDVTLGRPLDVESQGYPSTSALISSLWENTTIPLHQAVGHQYFVEVEDVARLHFAAATTPDVHDERLFAFGATYTWHQILDILRELGPERQFPEPWVGAGFHHEVKPRARAEQLLRQLGRPGWTSLRDSILHQMAQ